MLGNSTVRQNKMKILLCTLASMASLSCSGVIFHREYSLHRKFAPKDVEIVSRVAQQSGFKLNEPNRWFRDEYPLDFLAMRLQDDGSTLLFHSGLLPGPTLYVYPGPDRWTKRKETEVDAIVADLRNHGLNLKPLTHKYPQPQPLNEEAEQD